MMGTPHHLCIFWTVPRKYFTFGLLGQHRSFFICSSSGTIPNIGDKTWEDALILKLGSRVSYNFYKIIDLTLISDINLVLACSALSSRTHVIFSLDMLLTEGSKIRYEGSKVSSQIWWRGFFLYHVEEHVLADGHLLIA